MRVPRPRQVARWLLYLACASILIFIGRQSGDNRGPTSKTASLRSVRRSSASSTAIDYTWGSLLYRFENHPEPAASRSSLPWKVGKAIERRSISTRALIVTSELAGLHKNGGIGTAFTELAIALAASERVNVSILVAHTSDEFPLKQRETLEQSLAQQSITLHFVLEEPQPFFPGAWTPIASRRVHAFLKSHEEEWDLVHFPDNTGIGYFSALARHEGLMLQRTRIIVGLHGADVEWAAILNKRYPLDKYAIQLGEFERGTVELADVVVSPSAYMLEYLARRGWTMPVHSLVIPNIVTGPSLEFNRSAHAPDIIQPINELVFFGRLEERKGTRLFVNALELLFEEASALETPQAINTITFLGRDADDGKTRLEASALISQAMGTLREHSDVEFRVQFLKDHDREQALTYISDPSRLVVLPALADNSPSTVLECIVRSARFIASNVGGIPELVHLDDHARVLFVPRAAPLAAKIIAEIHALETAPWPSIRPRPKAISAAADWIDLHSWVMTLPSSSIQRPAIPLFRPLVSVIITHFERTDLVTQMLDSVINQTYTRFELILVDDGSTSSSSVAALRKIEAAYFATRADWRLVRIANSYLGEARNRGAEFSRGSWLLFLDDDDVLKPHALQTLVDVAGRTGAKALSSWLDEFATDINPLFATEKIPHRRTYWFLGSSLGSGMISNSFGSGNIFVEREVFEDLGGFSTYREVGAEDWQFYVRLALKGYKQLVVPEELIFVRSDVGRSSMKFSMDPWDANFHALAPLLGDDRIQELGLSHLLMFAKGAIDHEHPRFAFADSDADFELAQGWRGWTYSFEPAGATPTLESAHHAEAMEEEMSWGVDRAPSKPFINARGAKPYITTRGERFLAVRTFTAPRELQVMVEMTLHASHQCGDGTEVTFASRFRQGKLWTTHAKIRTMESGSENVRVDLSLSAGSVISFWIDPLETDECDAVEMKIVITPIEFDNKAWSGIAKRLEQEEDARKRQVELERQAELKATDTTLAEPTRADEAEEDVPLSSMPGPTDFFHIALIFDKNRLEQAKQVIRSAIKFLTSRPSLHFHLVASNELHDGLRDFFLESPHAVSTYDHDSCAVYAAQVLPFSEDGIHISAHCKMFLAKILDFTDQVLYLDTDVTVLSDLSSCYTNPLDKRVLFKMGVDMGDACQLRPDLCWPIGLHWRVPEGLECGNLAERNWPDLFENGGRCPSSGDLETIQVNGGVAFMQLDRMRETGFTERYIRTVARTFRAVGRTARWGEQDFINSYFRIFPEELELLPCGCNYQWLGRRKEVKCGNQPIIIAHHWSMGIDGRGSEKYNELYYQFLDAGETALNASQIAHSDFSPLTESHPSIHWSGKLEVLHDPNCLLQSHDCSEHNDMASAFGQPIFVLSRIKSELLAGDLYASFDEQIYSLKRHFVVAHEGSKLPPVESQREVLGVIDFEGDLRRLCDRCGDLAAEVPGAGGRGLCNVAPNEPEARKRYWECACRVEDPTYASMYDLDALAMDVGVFGWILYLDDDKLFVDGNSISRLMTFVDDEMDLIVFRSNTTSISNEHELDYRNKSIQRCEMDGVGFLFHSSQLKFSEWSDRRCAKSDTFARLSSRLRLRWIDLVPTVTHPLQRHLLRLDPPTLDLFKLSVVVLETQGGLPEWTGQIVSTMRDTTHSVFLGDLSVLTANGEESKAYEGNATIVNSTVGAGLSQIARLGASKGVLILTDSVRLEKPALTALLTFSLDEPDRLIGLFTESDPSAFTPHPDGDPEYFVPHQERHPMLGIPRYSHLQPRALIVSRSHLATLAELHLSSPIHPQCHPMLLSAIAYNISSKAPLRVLAPPKSIIDHVHDCRLDDQYDIIHGLLPGDPAPPSMDQLDDPEFELEEEPSLEDCFKIVSDRMGWERWEIWSEEIGIAAALGAKEGIVNSSEVDDSRWQISLKEEGCKRGSSEQWVAQQEEDDEVGEQYLDEAGDLLADEDEL